MSAVLQNTLPPGRWRDAGLAMGLVLLAVLLLYRDTFVAMAGIWARSETFAHAWLVPPIVLWLVWRMRRSLAQLSPRPAPWVLLPMAVVALGWLLGDLAGVNAVTQLAVTALLVLTVPAVLGLQVARHLMFPLGFLFFMVPIGEFTTDIMMEWTADFTVWALVATGIPVYREGLQFIIPSGAWSVVEACSGVRYLIASFMVGTLFAYLNYSLAWKRWAFVGLSILVPIVANWVRAYMIVMIGHLSGNKLAVGVDHLIYGWVFFGVVIGIMFVLGARWADPAPAEDGSGPAPAAPLAAGPAWQWQAAALALAVAAAAPLAAWSLQHPASAPPVALTLPALQGAPDADSQALAVTPQFEGAAAQAHRVYAVDGGTVAVHLAYYRHQGYGAKLTSSSNVLLRYDDTHWKRLTSGSVQVDVSALGASVALRAVQLIGGHTAAVVNREHLAVRQVMWSGGRFTTSNQRATVYAVLARLAGQGDHGAMLTFSTPGQGPEAAARVEAFVARHLAELQATLEATRAAAR
jgi:exosortase A